MKWTCIYIQSGRNNEVINATDETYGKDANTILREVMEVSSRPDIIRFLFEKFYELLDSGEWKMAEEIIGQLEKEIGNNDPEINWCENRGIFVHIVCPKFRKAEISQAVYLRLR